MDYTKTSKYLSLLLRHKPEVGNITLDKNGWAPVKDILKALKVNMEVLEDIVYTDSKCRYSFNDNKTKIRANQGHSVSVDVELQEVVPPDILYHGTSTKSLESIKKDGIKSMSRQYVHLSLDMDTAVKVGSRHGKPVILAVNSKQMYEDGYRFYISVNNVYLTDNVPYNYLHINQ